MATDEHFEEERDTSERGSELVPDNLVDLDGLSQARGDYDEADSAAAARDELAMDGAPATEAEELAPEEAAGLDVVLAKQDILDETQVAAPADEAAVGLSALERPASEEEFACRTCFLLKPRAQLADQNNLVCLDCAA